ncbi:MAG: tyrosine-type recombinase/integrase [Candidatus Dormiibacterota bacterium]
MTALAPTLELFFTERLVSQRQVSPNTVAAYRDSWRLLLRYANASTGKEPTALELTDLDAPLISGFLDHLEAERHNTARTRNARLAAIRSFFRFAALRHPEHAGLIARVLAIPSKRFARPEISFLDRGEIEALVASPDTNTWNGRRDHALLAVATQTGLRVSELTGLRNKDVELGAGAHVHCTGKGRKQRSTPLTRESVAVLRTWVRENGGDPDHPLFPTRQGTQLSRDAVGDLVTKHTATAQQTCPSLATKNVTPHVLRHSCAMEFLRSGVDRMVMALWLGHESVETTSIYVHGDLAIKERALARTTPTRVAPGRYRPQDKLLAFLTSL